MRMKVYLAIGLTILFLAPLPGLTQFQGGGGGRSGGSRNAGGPRWDPNEMFNRMSNGKDVLVRSEITDPRTQNRFDQWAQQLNITNGQITREQFLGMMQQRAGGWQSGGGRAPQSSPARGDQNAGNDADAWSRWAENLFRRLDQNGDGFLNNDEMNVPMLEGLRAELDKWDTDHNGLIDLNEFKAYFQARVQQFQADRASAGNPGWSGEGAAPGALLTPAPAQAEETKPVVYRAGKLPKELPAWFQQLDTDGDGQIGLYEWKASGRPIAEFEKMDRNKDGFLTIAEVLRYTAEQQAKSTGGPGQGAQTASAANGFSPSQGMPNGQFSRSTNGSSPPQGMPNGAFPRNRILRRGG